MIFESLLSLMINVGVVVVHICYTLIVVKVIFTLFIQLSIPQQLPLICKYLSYIYSFISFHYITYLVHFVYHNITHFRQLASHQLVSMSALSLIINNVNVDFILNE
jgi:hypothetical protein